jgi:hypothetical protein
MARHLNTIPGRLVVMLLLIHALLMPPLFYAISGTVESTMKDSFIDKLRNVAQIFVDRFDTLEPNASEQRIVELLDSAILSGQGRYAAVDIAELFQEDFDFGENGDDVYYLSLPVSGLTEPAVLKLGYDESTIHEDLDRIRRTLIYVLSAPASHAAGGGTHQRHGREPPALAAEGQPGDQFGRRRKGAAPGQPAGRDRGAVE